MAVFKVVQISSKLKCVNGGSYTISGGTSNVTNDGDNVALVQDSASGSPCAKAPPAFPPPMACTSFLPLQSLEFIGVTYEGKRPIVEFSLQFSQQNMIPAFIYDTVTPNVKID